MLFGWENACFFVLIGENPIWVGKCLFFWVIGWKKPLASNDRGPWNLLQILAVILFFYLKKKWGEHPEFEHPEYGRFQVVHVYRKCFFLKECHLLVLCFLGKVGWFLDVGSTEKNGPTFDWGEGFFRQVSLVGSEKTFPAFPNDGTNRVYT